MFIKPVKEYRVASMDICKLKNIMLWCDARKIKCRFVDDGVNPFAVMVSTTREQFLTLISYFGLNNVFTQRLTGDRENYTSYNR